MKFQAGSYGEIESLPTLIDPNSGTVHLRLVPSFLERLHSPEQRGDFVPCGGDPDGPYAFPLLRGGTVVDIALKGGMGLRQVAAGLPFELAGDQWSRSWWRWIAYALTPFGWVAHPTPQFRRKHRRRFLASLDLAPSCGANENQNFNAARQWLTTELGPPHNLEDSLTWKYGWGSVWLGYEWRDGAAEVDIRWEPFSTELTLEAKRELENEE